MKTKNLATSKVVSFDSEGSCFSTKVLLDFILTYGKYDLKKHGAKQLQRRRTLLYTYMYRYAVSQETASGLIHMAGFLETSFDHPKTAKVPLNALIFSPVEIWLVQLRNAKTKILFRIHFFAIFDFRPGGSNGEPGGVTAGGYKKKVDKKFLQINTNNFPSLGQA